MPNEFFKILDSPTTSDNVVIISSGRLAMELIDGINLKRQRKEKVLSMIIFTHSLNKNL